MLFAEGAGAPLRLPSGLLPWLAADLPLLLRAAAARTAWQALETLFPAPPWIPDPEPPPVPSAELLHQLERAIQGQTPIDIQYQKPHHAAPEYRHLTPILLEQRGLRFYLIAYCHTRRANRTFRLDRLELLQEPPG